MNTFAEFAAYESWAATSKSAFEKWAERVERIVGHDLDGDQNIDGYSLDFALDQFNAGVTAAAYAASLQEVA